MLRKLIVLLIVTILPFQLYSIDLDPYFTMGGIGIEGKNKGE